jgi:anti-sigma factor RsiW
MDCARIDLIAYHFGTQDEHERDAAEEHLLACTRCLASYLALKRASEGREGGLSGAERPSAAVRERLRRDVERAFPQPSPWRPYGWLVRPIPLYQGLAAATLALLVAAFAPALAERARSGGSGRTLQGGEQVDTSRPSAESFTIY